MSDIFDCMLVVSGLSETYTPENPDITIYPTAETVVAESSDIQLLAISENARDVIELDMTADDLQSFLEQLASKGLDVSEVYESVKWTFKKAD